MSGEYGYVYRGAVKIPIPKEVADMQRSIWSEVKEKEWEAWMKKLHIEKMKEPALFKRQKDRY